VFSVTLNLGIQGIWWGIVVSNVSAGMIGFLFATLYIHKSAKKQEQTLTKTIKSENKHSKKQ
jgi:Na+-driven multidrug efflux pump